MLKDVSSKDADWIRDLRIILIAAQKNYVLDAPLGVPPALATADIVNSWQSRVGDYSLVQCRGKPRAPMGPKSPFWFGGGWVCCTKSGEA